MIFKAPPPTKSQPTKAESRFPQNGGAFISSDSLCVICPTRNRYDRLTDMIKSYSETVDDKINTTLVIAVDSDDKTDYKKLAFENNIVLISSNQPNITTYINKIYNAYKGLDNFFYVINDDFLFRTYGWNALMVDKCRENYICYPNDGNNSKSFPTSFMISSKILDIVGWLQMPKLTHLCGDSVWNYIINKCNIGYYCKDVLIEHMHYLYRKSEIDDIYEKTNSKDMYVKDNESFRKWIREESEEVCKNVKMALQNMR